MAGPREPDRPVENKTKQEIDHFLYESPDTRLPTLGLGDKLIQTLGTETEDLFDSNARPTKKAVLIGAKSISRKYKKIYGKKGL